MAPELLRHLWETHGQQLTSQLRGVAVYEVLRYSGRQVLIEFRRCGIPADPGVIPLVRCPAANTGGLRQHSWLEISVGIAMGAPKVGGCPLRGILAVNRHMTRRVAWELATARVSGVPVSCRPCPDRARAARARAGSAWLHWFACGTERLADAFCSPERSRTSTILRCRTMLMIQIGNDCARASLVRGECRTPVVAFLVWRDPRTRTPVERPS